MPRAPLASHATTHILCLGLEQGAVPLAQPVHTISRHVHADAKPDPHLMLVLVRPPFSGN
ncbi:hypothetical protein BCR44DRAFT_1451270 [Catenaria anguillulae PL171]|uniref:Uncharacterized protein n=1 Tax=Catenaria anguillulae PL171 TaxID=765915 RepID=A0A1Y2H4D1_9FUNG|nr:hypothetical protein BCR44DRAFT_1451270 [Catenaria anguillulae PL171]